ncbi:hypothetical protein DRO64_04600 [Candidatus Bathyarchaeota archaeon]|nr:MAG: hypothetical protein DRO64_04600 [Candidatus Bathyarchaeota archaeon]
MKGRILRTIRVDPEDWRRFGKLANSIASDRSELIRRAIRSVLKDRKLLDEIIRKGGG